MIRQLVCTAIVTLTLWQPAGKVSHQFDTTKPTSARGIVHGMTWDSNDPHVFIALAVQTRPGEREVRWVLRGDTRDALQRAGWKFGPGGSLELGREVSATGYPPKSDVNLSELIAAWPPWMRRAAKTASVLHGIEITRLEDGKKLYLGPKQ